MPRRNIKKLKAQDVTPRSLPARGAKTAAMAGLAAVSDIESEVQIEEEAMKTVAANDVNFADSDTDTKPKLEAEPEQELEPMELVEQTPRTPATVFMNFSTPTKLLDGLCIVRSLGDGKYEMLNFDNIIAEDLAEEKNKKTLTSDEGRIELFGLNAKAWDVAAFKCNQVLMNAAGKVFPFLKLPIEIRYLIYDICLVSKTTLVYAPRRSSLPSNSSFNTALLRTCRVIFDESIKFWRKNTFRLNVYSSHNDMKLQCSKNVQHLEIDLNGTYKTDIQLLEILPACQNLKTLKVKYGDRILSMHSRNRRQHTHQTDPKVLEFRQINGHDILCSLQGLDNITLIAPTPDTHRRIKNEHLRLYEEYLFGLVTLPKPSAEYLAFLKKRKTERPDPRRREKMQKTLRGKRVKKYAGDDGEYDGSWD